MAFVEPAELTQALQVGDLYPDEFVQSVCDAANLLIAAYVDDAANEFYPANCKEAALTIAIDIWSNRTAPGGQMAGVDFTPAPYRMGRSLISRVAGLLALNYNVNGLVG